ncbi:MAG: cyclase family protein [Actinomycetota bacterium]|nr:cyclase family protein [Actinomycetota bacterium]
MHEKLLDLTMPFSERTIPVPGHPCPRFEPLTTLERDGVRNTTMTMSIHTGTHIDAPSHFIPDGAAIDEVSIDRFRRPGVCLDLRDLADPGAPITQEHLKKAGFDPTEARGTILMLASGWSDRAWESERLYEMNPYLAQDAAEALAEASPSALGLDFAVDEAKPWPNHTILLGADVLLIENLMSLPELPRDGFDVMAFPLKLVGENGGPTRVVAELNR